MAATLLLFHFVWTVGDRGRARRLRDVLRTARSSPSITPIVTVIASTWGDFSYEYGFGGSLPRCLASLHEASELATARGVPVYDASLFGGMAYCHLTSGQIADARWALEQMEQALNWERSQVSHCGVRRSQLEFWHGQTLAHRICRRPVSRHLPWRPARGELGGPRRSGALLGCAGGGGGASQPGLSVGRDAYLLDLVGARTAGARGQVAHCCIRQP
jgi:hypothetical protein